MNMDQIPYQRYNADLKAITVRLRNNKSENKAMDVYSWLQCFALKIVRLLLAKRVYTYNRIMEPIPVCAQALQRTLTEFGGPLTGVTAFFQSYGTNAVIRLESGIATHSLTMFPPNLKALLGLEYSTPILDFCTQKLLERNFYWSYEFLDWAESVIKKSASEIYWDKELYLLAALWRVLSVFHNNGPILYEYKEDYITGRVIIFKTTIEWLAIYEIDSTRLDILNGKYSNKSYTKKERQQCDHFQLESVFHTHCTLLLTE